MSCAIYPQQACVVQAKKECVVEFEQVSKLNLDRFALISEIFHRVLEPLYGPQAKALGQILESTDRKCFLLFENRIPSGVLVFKTELSDEFERHGVKKSIEIKSLFVDNSGKNSGRGLGSKLVERLTEEVNAMDLGEEGIHVTVSEKKPESLSFFQKKGFKITHEWKGRYADDVVEYLLFCPKKIYTQ
jgi:ribosomal protein S18 acetylase RimI-like enzyme